MSRLSRFFASDRVRYRSFQFFFVAAALNFIIPAISYIVAPHLAVQTMNDVNQLFGGPAWPQESGQVWHMLAVGNVMTLGFLCAIIAVDVIRHYRMLPALIFLKMFSALYSLALALTVDGVPAFFGVFAVDGSTALGLWFFGVIGYRAARRLPKAQQPMPLWGFALVRPRRVQRRLAEIESHQKVAAPTLWQMVQWTARMWHRVVFDLDSVGSGGANPIRPNTRARVLALKPLRVLPLLAERAISPLDMSGLATSTERVIRHLCGAHHDGLEFTYDLEMLSFREGALDLLHDRVKTIVDGTHPRSEWLKDLCVYEGYHERLLENVKRAQLGTLPRTRDVNASFFAMLAWARSQPAAPLSSETPGEAESSLLAS